MKKFYVLCRAFLILICLFFSILSPAQFRKLGFLYSENISGGAVMFGNTLMYSANPDGTVNNVAMNGNSVDGNSLYDNGNYGATSMQYVDIDGNTGEGSATRNSSSADLILPPGTNTIKFARLYWGGRAFSSSFNIADQANQTIKIRKNTTGPYTEFAAAQIDRSVFDLGKPVESSRYQAFADITELVKEKGAGTYTVGNGAFTTGTGGDFGNYGGWCIVVVYENPDVNFNSVRIIDGFQEIYAGSSAFTNTLLITGLNVPSETLAPQDAQIGVMTWEGDARFNGDYFKIYNSTLLNAVNSLNNCFNGTISIEGVHVTSKNPNYTDQMGIDIDRIYIGRNYGLTPNLSTIPILFGTNQDQYFGGIITAVIKMKESAVKIVKSVTDASNDQIAGTGEVLTYKIKGKNYGTGNTNSVFVTDSLTSAMIFVPNSLRVNYCPGFVPGALTDSVGDDAAEYNAANNRVNFRLGNGADNDSGGSLNPLDSFEVSFQVRFNPVANGVSPPIINVARVTAKSDAGDNYVDDATVTISGATAQRISYTFTGNGNWNDAANWANNILPPANLPVFSTIIINPISGGQCVLNVTQSLATGSSLLVNAGKNLVVAGNLQIR